MEHYDVLIVGGGAAGISAAAAAAAKAKVLLCDSASSLGGVLLQCAHKGFAGDMDGREYAKILVDSLPDAVELALDTTVLEIRNDKTALLSSAGRGRYEIAFSRLILASGCREIPAGALPIAGTRPEGVYTAGHMQKLINIYAYVPEGPAVILGSGDVGLVMAAELAKRGVHVTVVEQEERCSGMARNRRELEKYPVDFIFNNTVSELCGESALEAVILRDGRRLDCSLFLTAVGLLPERELIRHLGAVDWLELCGNCKSIHPMIEGVVAEGRETGLRACSNLR